MARLRSRTYKCVICNKACSFTQMGVTVHLRVHVASGVITTEDARAIVQALFPQMVKDISKSKGKEVIQRSKTTLYNEVKRMYE